MRSRFTDTAVLFGADLLILLSGSSRVHDIPKSREEMDFNESGKAKEDNGGFYSNSISREWAMDSREKSERQFILQK